MTCACPACGKIYKVEDGEPCPFCQRSGVYYKPRTVSDLDCISETHTRDKFHHKIDSEVHT